MPISFCWLLDGYQSKPTALPNPKKQKQNKIQTKEANERLVSKTGGKEKKKLEKREN